jgi:hypothetical protein
MRNALCGALAVLLLLGVSTAGKKLIRLYGTDSELRAAFPKELDVVGSRPGFYVDVIVKESDLLDVTSRGIPSDIVLDDVEAHMEAVRESYWSLDGALSQLETWANAHPTLTELDTLAYSYENRPIVVMKISDDPAYDDPDEKDIFFVAMHHAREWPTVSICMFAIDTLLSAYGSDPVLTDYVDTREIYILPILNPDGYRYSHDLGHDWRKNRRYFPQYGTYGVDPNRNYAGGAAGIAQSGWGVTQSYGTTHGPSSETYCGPYPFSEVETQVVRDFMAAHDFPITMSYHTHAPAVLFPWAFTSGPAPDYSLLDYVATQVGNRVGYPATQAPGIGYTCTGSTDDWAYGYYHYVDGLNTLAFTIEACNQFQPPESQLAQVVRDNWDGIEYLIEIVDTIGNALTPRVIVQGIEAPDTALGGFTLEWSPTDPRCDWDLFELEELTGPNPILDDAETANTLWSFDDFSRSTERAHSGSYSFKASYSSNAANCMKTAIPYFVSPGDSLVFWTWYDLETNYDYGYAEVSLYGRHFIVVDTLSLFTGSSSGWERKAYSLDAYAGKSIFVQFRFTSDGSSSGDGFFVDDVYPTGSFDNVSTISSSLTDTSYLVAGNPEGAYYYRVKGHNSEWGWGDFSVLKKVQLIPSGPYVIYSGHEIDDAAGGNGDGDVNPGEACGMTIWVKNAGVEDAYDVDGVLRSADPFVVITDSLESFGTIPVGDSVQGTLAFEVDLGAPDAHTLPFQLVLSDTSTDEWTSNLSDVVKGLDLAYLACAIDDEAGNGDGVLDPDEVADLDVTLENSGLADGEAVSATLSTSDPYVTVNVGTADFSYLPSGGVGSSVTPFEIYVHSDCPIPHFPEMILDVTGDFAYAVIDTFTLSVGGSGYSSDVESTDGWTHAACQGGFDDEWHWSTERANSPTHAWKCGTVGGNYSNYLDACLETPEFVLAPGSELTFFHWIDAETSGYYTGECYDAGIVQIQVDGAAWTTIEPEGGYPYLIRSGSGHPFPGVPGFSGYYPTWRQATFDLSGHSGLAKVRFRFGSDQGSTAEGWYIDDVTIGSVGAPDIDLDPWSFTFTLTQDDSDTDLLFVSNAGQTTLSYDIVVQGDSALVAGERIIRTGRGRVDWLTAVPDAGTAEPGESDTVTVQVDATGLEAGTYWATLRVSSNDPDEAWLLVPVELEVTEGLCGDANGDGSVTSGDGFHILNYFGAGPPPVSMWAANVNGDGSLTTGDGFHLLNYLGAGDPLDCNPVEWVAPIQENLRSTE